MPCSDCKCGHCLCNLTLNKFDDKQLVLAFYTGHHPDEYLFPEHILDIMEAEINVMSYKIKVQRRRYADIEHEEMLQQRQNERSSTSTDGENNPLIPESTFGREPRQPTPPQNRYRNSHSQSSEREVITVDVSETDENRYSPVSSASSESARSQESRDRFDENESTRAYAASEAGSLANDLDSFSLNDNRDVKRENEKLTSNYFQVRDRRSTNSQDSASNIQSIAEGHGLALSDFVRNNYLTVEKVSSNLENNKLNSPLGICFDEIKNIWIVADSGNNRVVLLGGAEHQTLEEPQLIRNPSAVCIIKPGISWAVLCQTAIIKVEYDGMHLFPVKRSPNLEYRGLACTPNGYLLTVSKLEIAMFDPMKADTKVFKCQIIANQPSFLNMNGPRLAITDLGTQTLMVYDVDDASSEAIRVRHRKSYTKKLAISGASEGGFNFISSVFIDKDYNLLVADAGSHTLQLFDSKLEFIHRVSSNFKLPYISGFTVNLRGEIMMVDRRTGQIVAGKLSNAEEPYPYKPVPFSGAPRGRGRGRGRGIGSR